MFIKTETGIILNWDAISKVVIEQHTTHRLGKGSESFPSQRVLRVVAYIAHSNSPVVISSCDIQTAREIMDAIEEALIKSRTHPDLGSIFAKRQLARRSEKLITKTDNQ